MIVVSRNLRSIISVLNVEWCDKTEFGSVSLLIVPGYMAADNKRRMLEELIRMHHCYNKYHSYAKVARDLGRSASCVSYNIKMNGAPKVIKDTFPDIVRK